MPAELVPALAARLQELMDYRLAAYEVPLAPESIDRNVVSFPVKRHKASYN